MNWISIYAFLILYFFVPRETFNLNLNSTKSAKQSKESEKYASSDNLLESINQAWEIS
jgi:hypothetical protein